MENKYYTPSIEEFHVGFEYEAVTNPNITNLNWSKRLVDMHSNLVAYSAMIGSGLVRVKFLDRQDIEELGWGYSETYSENEIFTKKVTIIRGEYDAYLHYVEYTKWVMIYLKNETESHTVFAGTIRNKSQLRQLMAWLNIE
jgi:hypothetical protein